MALYPLLCGWLREAPLSPQSLEDAYLALREMLEPVVVNRFRNFRYSFYDTDVADCLDEVCDRMERRLAKPVQEFTVKLAPCPTDKHVGDVKPLHLLRREPFAIIGRHSDLKAATIYRAAFRDREGIVVATLNRLACTKPEFLHVDLTYDQLHHEQDTQMEVGVDGYEMPGYIAWVRAVQHESLARRQAFVIGVARNVAYERFRDKPQVESIEDLPLSATPAGADEGRQQPAILLAKSVIKSIPREEFELLHEHIIEGLSWKESAERHKITPAKAKKDVSRALRKLATTLAKAFIVGQPESGGGAVRRFVKWIKEIFADLVP